uniref:Large ribosomal subunit protein bL32 n=1 Tax=candidate division CPR3 bacterium TaxID=2268181 RepID=A0A7C4M0N3_UNCC3
MAEPKKKMSKMRTATRRRQNQKVKTSGISVCKQCKSPKIPHQICKVCGTYNGRQIKNPSVGKIKTKTK